MTIEEALQRRWVESLRSLKQGDYSHWPKHEYIRSGRRDVGFNPTPTYGKPIWKGEEEDITLLVNADFGMGDTIQFVRYCPEMEKLVSKLILRCDDEFHPLFPHLKCVGKTCDLPKFDKIIHLMALHAFWNDDIDIPYLKPNFDIAGHQDIFFTLDVMEFTKIGICWRGNVFNPRDARRNMSPKDFKPIEGLGVRPITLQREYDCPPKWLDFRGVMTDWNNTAVLIEKLDLVISVDTAIAHLAGALGKEVWLLIPSEAEWRWGQSGETTPWYPSMKIFRGRQVIKQIMESLKEI